MVKAYQRGSSKNCHMAIRRRHGGDIIRMAFTHGSPQMAYRVDFQMKMFLMASTIIVFFFSSFSGASLHSLADLKHQNGVLAARLVTMSLRSLSEVNI